MVGGAGPGCDRRRAASPTSSEAGSHPPAPDRLASIQIRAMVAEGAGGAESARTLLETAKDRTLTLAQRAHLPKDSSLQRSAFRSVRNDVSH